MLIRKLGLVYIMAKKSKNNMNPEKKKDKIPKKMEQQVDKAVKEVVNEYGDVLLELGKE